jgi:hypothetical protein
LQDLTTTKDPKTGKDIINRAQVGRIKDQMGRYNGPEASRMQRDLIGLDNFVQQINKITGVQFNDITEIFDLGPDGGIKRVSGEFNDIFNSAGFGVEEWLSDTLPFGESGDVLIGTKNGREVRISSEHLENIGLSPRAIKQLYQDRSRANQ